MVKTPVDTLVKSTRVTSGGVGVKSEDIDKGSGKDINPLASHYQCITHHSARVLMMSAKSSGDLEICTWKVISVSIEN